MGHTTSTRSPHDDVETVASKRGQSDNTQYQGEVLAKLWIDSDLGNYLGCPMSEMPGVEATGATFDGIQNPRMTVRACVGISEDISLQNGY